MRRRGGGWGLSLVRLAHTSRPPLVCKEARVRENCFQMYVSLGERCMGPAVIEMAARRVDLE